MPAWEAQGEPGNPCTGKSTCVPRHLHLYSTVKDPAVLQAGFQPRSQREQTWGPLLDSIDAVPQRDQGRSVLGQHAPSSHGKSIPGLPLGRARPPPSRDTSAPDQTGSHRAAALSPQPPLPQVFRRNGN